MVFNLKSRWKALGLWPKRALKVLGALIIAPFVLTLVYAFVPPPVTNLMLLRVLQGNGITKDWVSIDQMSPYLAASVMSSEDARFCSHWGVDWTEMQGVIDDVFDDDEGPVRGASTISMQTAKNLFLWDGRSFVRKVAGIAYRPVDGRHLDKTPDDGSLSQHR